MEKLKKELLYALSGDLERISEELTAHTHDIVLQSVERRMNGVIDRLEEAIAGGLAEIAGDVKTKIDNQITERFALIAGEVRMRLRKLDARAGGPKKGFNPAATLIKPPFTGTEMASVQAECQTMLDKLNSKILTAKGCTGYTPKCAKKKRQDYLSEDKQVTKQKGTFTANPHHVFPPSNLQ